MNSSTRARHGKNFGFFSTTHLYTGVLVAKNEFFPEQLLFFGTKPPSAGSLSGITTPLQRRAGQTTDHPFSGQPNRQAHHADGGLSECMDGLEKLEPSYREILSKDEAREILLSPGLINDILINVRVVRAILN